MLNMPPVFWIGFVGGIAIGFTIGGKIGFLAGLSKDIKFYRSARIIGPIVEE